MPLGKIFPFVFPSRVATSIVNHMNRTWPLLSSLSWIVNMPVGSRKYDSLRLCPRPVSAFANPKSPLPRPGVPDVGQQQEQESWWAPIECRHPDVDWILDTCIPHSYPCTLSPPPLYGSAAKYECKNLHPLSCGQQQQTSSRTSCSLLLCRNPAPCPLCTVFTFLCTCIHL